MTLAGEARTGRKITRARAAERDNGGGSALHPDPDVLLAWYDRERRVLPWRAAPGETPDPYRIWLSEIMLQQTRVEAVVHYFDRFLARFPTVEALAAARLDSVLKLWAGLGYYARARNLHACAREVVRSHGGRFPDSEAELHKLPGIGPYTSAAIAAIAFGRKAAPVDGNIERVLARAFAIETPLPAAKPELRRLAEALVPERRAGDFAQAMMDLGARICTPKRPDCARCPWQGACRAHLLRKAEEYPRRAQKTEGRTRRGAAFLVLRADGAILVRRRATNGLLGGMIELPSTDWSAAFDLREGREAGAALLPFVSAGEWRRLPGIVRHVFSHFPLELVLFEANVPKGTRPPRGMRFVPLTKLGGEALPSLTRKVVAHALDGRKELSGLMRGSLAQKERNSSTQMVGKAG